MRIDAIRNCRMAISAPKNSSSHSLPKKNEAQLNTENQDALSFQKGTAVKGSTLSGLFGNTAKGTSVFSNTAKGATFGTGLGLGAITLLATANGLSTSRGLRVAYAAAFGVAGIIAGRALDDAEKNGEVKFA